MTKKSSAPIDRGWAWMVVLGVFVNAFFMMGITKSSGIFLVEFMDRFQVSTAYAGTAMTVGNLIFALGAPIAGVLGDKVTHRKLMMFGGVVGMICLSLCCFLISMPYVIVFFALGLGIGNSCSYGGGMVMIGKYFRKKRSTATGIALSGSSFGYFAMPPIVEYLLETYGLGGTLLLVGAFYLHCSLAGALLRPIDLDETEDNNQAKVQKHQVIADEDCVEKTRVEDKSDGNSSEMEMLVNDGFKDDEKANGDKMLGQLKSEAPEIARPTISCDDITYTQLSSENTPFNLSDTKTENNKDIDIDNGHVGAKCSTRKELIFASLLKLVGNFSILRNYLIVHFVVVSYCAFLGITVFTMFIPAIAVDRGMTKYHKAILVSLSGLGDLIARLVMGYIADRQMIKRYKLKSMTTFISALNMVAFIFADSFYWMGVHCIIFGLAAGAYVCLMPVVILDFLSLDVLSIALGMSVFALGLSASSGQFFLGFIRDLTGSYSLVLLILAISTAVSGILLIFTPYVWRLEQRRATKSKISAQEDKSGTTDV